MEIKSCITASAEISNNWVDLPNLGNSFLKFYRLLCYSAFTTIANDWWEWFVTCESKLQRKKNIATLLTCLMLTQHMKTDTSHNVYWSASCSSSQSAGRSFSMQDQLVLWGGGSGGDPLSVMGQGYTIGVLCKICWGWTAVGTGLALISVCMFTGVCHVWKLIRSMTFPSHNHLRNYICPLK